MQSLQMEIEKAYDVIFVIESTAINGAYMHDLKINYMIPTLEYFSQSLFEEREYLTPEKTSMLYGVVLYKTAQSMPNNSTVTFGPFFSPQEVINFIDKLTMTGGGSESNANLAEGLATALCCFEDFRKLRFSNDINVQKHCILICNSTPYSMPVLECYHYEGKNVEQLASIFHEKKINFSIISPRKIPILFKLFIKADGDLPLTSKNFCKDPRHLVLLKGFNLKERPVSPNVNSNQMQQQHSSQSQLTTVAANISNSLINQNTISNSNSIDNLQNNAIVSAMSNLQQQQNHLQSNQQQIHPTILTQQQALQQSPNYNSNVQPVSRWLFQNQPRASFNQLPLGAINVSANIQSSHINGSIGSNSNSALISQLNLPPNPPGMNINQQMQSQMLTPAQQQMRMQLINQQQQITQQVNSMQQQPLNPQHQHIHPQQNQQVSVLQTGSNTSVNCGSSSSSSSTSGTSSSGEREKIWSGTLEWVEKSKTDQSKSSRCVQSQVIANVKDGEVEVKADNWPPRLLMQLMPKHLVGNIGGEFLKDSKVVVFKPQPSESLEALCKIMNSGFAGCVHFTGSPQAPSCDIRILILLYTPEKKTFLGFIPNDQTMFVDQLRKVIQQKQQPGMNSQQQQHQPQQTSQIVSQSVVSGNISMVGNIGGNPLQTTQSSILQDNQQQHFNVYNQNPIQMQIQQDQMQNNMQQMNLIQQRSGMGGMMQPGPTGVNMSGIQGGPNPINSTQSRMVRPMLSNPGLRMLLQQPGAQPGNQFRPQLQQMVGSNPNMMGGGGSGQLPRSNTYEDSNFDFM